MKKQYKISRYIILILTILISNIILTYEEDKLRLIIPPIFSLIAFAFSFPSSIISEKFMKVGNNIKPKILKILFYIFLPIILLLISVIIIATPVYMGNVTPQLFSIITRLNMIWCNKFFINKKINFKEKRGILVLTGGGNGEPKVAIEMSKKIFKYLNAKFDMNKDYIYSLNTNKISAKDDKNLKDLLDIFNI